MLLPITVTVQLSWNIPTLRADSTPLPISEISNYNSYYGKTSGIYNNEVTLHPGTLSHVTIVVPFHIYVFLCYNYYGYIWARITIYQRGT